jgi:hypothetical protein
MREDAPQLKYAVAIVQLLPVLALKQGVQHICKRVSMLPMT